MESHKRGSDSPIKDSAPELTAQHCRLRVLLMQQVFRQEMAFFDREVSPVH